MASEIMPLVRNLGALLREQDRLFEEERPITARLIVRTARAQAELQHALLTQGFDETIAGSAYLNRRRRTLDEVLAERAKKGTP